MTEKAKLWTTITLMNGFGSDGTLTGELVLIEWVDSHHRAGWTTEKPADEPLTCLSVGWLTCDGADAKTIAPHVTVEDEPQRSGEMTIPAQAIVRMSLV